MTTDALTEAKQRIVAYAEREYVARGYMYSGAIGDGGHAGYDLRQTGLDIDSYRAAVAELVCDGVLVLRGSLDTTYALTAVRRRELIIEHDLHGAWEQGSGRDFYPHDPTFGEIPCAYREAAEALA